ncbi:ubiquitinyl hydrolase 1 [Exophiala xenobiotica]|nr:ubiquitinyl hydrolase 1 [Exophiala xenobiotica]KAK5550499.1 ubiquitinyl hydrolase 1 [Exophiala xenobiotica]
MYTKHFTPLESDPAIFSELIHVLGVEEKLEFVEIYSFDVDTLIYLPRPVLAVIVIFPDDDVAKSAITGFGEHSFTSEERRRVIWAKQTINNACGFYAALHAVCNGTAKDFIKSGSVFDIIASASNESRLDVANIIETSDQIQAQYANVAVKGSTSPGAPTDEVEYHYVCFTKATNSRLWLLDGDRDGPLACNEDCGVEGDVLDSPNRETIQRFLVEHGSASSNNFAMMALVQA